MQATTRRIQSLHLVDGAGRGGFCKQRSATSCACMVLERCVAVWRFGWFGGVPTLGVPYPTRAGRAPKSPPEYACARR